MNIGNKIKRLRLENGLTQEELANRSELTKGFISQVENEKTSPSVESFTYILEALGTNPAEFFSEEEDMQVVFNDSEYSVLEDNDKNIEISWIIPTAQRYEMEPIKVKFKENGYLLHEPHNGEEFGYVLKGKVKITLGNKYYLADEGESFYFLANKIHKVENELDTESEIIWVSSPPTF